MYSLLIIAIIFMSTTYAAEERAMDENPNIIGRVLSLDGTREAICYKNSKGEIRNLKTGKTLFEGNKITMMSVNSARTSVLFSYTDFTTEIRRLQSGEVLCKDSNVSKIKVGKKVACFLYQNGKVAMKNLEDGETLSEDEDVREVGILKYGAFFLTYKKGGMALKSPEDGKTIVEDKDAVGIELTEKKFCFLHKKVDE